MRLVLRLVFGVALVPAMAAPAGAEVKTLRLPADCADFAFDPDTGTVAAVVTEDSAVLLFPAVAWRAGSTKPAATVAVGARPVAIAFKRFKDRRVFVVGCQDDSHLYVFNADDGGAVRKIPLQSAGVSHVAASVNPDDPFVYFALRKPGVGGMDARVNAISLQTLEDLGTVITGCAELTVSASGDLGYQRSGSGNSEGLQGTVRVRDGAADKPAFAPPFSELAVAGVCVPDPFDRYTATGPRIYTSGLERPLADFDFVPRCWFRTRPLVIGVTPDEPGRAEAATLAEPPSSVRMRAASSNTLRPVGDVVAFELRPHARPGEPGANDARAAEKTLARLRMFAYDAGACVLYARRSYLAVVPLADFHAGDEPFLTATLTGHQPLLVGREAVLKLSPADPRVTARLEWMPDGMRVSGTELRWQPTAEQVGPNPLVVSLAHGDLEQTQTLALSVQRPSLQLPFAPLGCAVAEDGRTAVIWDGSDTENAWPPRPAPAAEVVPRMASIDIATGTVRADKRIPEAVHRAVVLGQRVFLLAPGANRCDVLDLMTLEPRTTLQTAGPIAGVGCCDGAIVFQSQSAVDVFDETTLEHRGRHAVEPPQARRPDTSQAVVAPPGPTILTRHGLVVQGVLLDAAGKPALLVQPGMSPAVPWGHQAGETAFLRSAIRPVVWRKPVFRSDSSGTSSLDSASIPRGDATAGLTLVLQERSRPGGHKASGWDFKLMVTASGDRPLSVVLDRQANVPLNPVKRASGRAAVCATAEVVLATFGDRMYPVPLPAAAAGDKPAPPVLTPRQSAFVLSTDGPTVLRHSVDGGQLPLAFSLVAAAPGMTIDAATGTVTIDRAAVVEAAAGELEKMLSRQPRNGSHVEAYRRTAADVGARLAAIIGRKITGYPVTVPIHVAVVDAEGRKDSLRYHVVAEIADSRLVPTLQKLDDDQSSPAAQAGTADGPERHASKPGEAGDLPRRIEALEQRIDLVTRQLNQILKRLDK